MERTMTFRELVKKIHPDVNPTITDASGKMVLAVKWKNHPTELYKLAIRWGIMGGSRPQRPSRPTAPPRPESRWVWVADVSATPRRGDFIHVSTLGIRVQIIRITPKRVYFNYNGRRTFAAKNNVYVMRKQRV